MSDTKDMLDDIIDDELKLLEDMMDLKVKIFTPINEDEHIFSNEFEEKMNEVIKTENIKAKREENILYFKKVMKVASISIATLTSVLFATTVSVEAHREKMLEIIKEVFNTHTSLNTELENENIFDEDYIFIDEQPTYLPYGYTINENESMSSMETYTSYTVYENSNGLAITYSQQVLLGEYFIDSEDVELDEFELYGRKINYSYKNGEHHLYWLEDMKLYHIIAAVDKKEMIKIAESIIVN